MFTRYSILKSLAAATLAAVMLAGCAESAYAPEYSAPSLTKTKSSRTHSPTPVAETPPPVETQPTVDANGCSLMPSGITPDAPSVSSAQGVPGTTSDDLYDFAYQYNTIRVANCLEPIPFSNIKYDSCMESRLFWMAESPSSDPTDAWGHEGSVRSDGVPSTGCDGNIAGGSDNTGAMVAQKWWDSPAHQASLYRPGTSVAGACILFSMTHGGIDEPYNFVRSAARWIDC